MSISLVVNGVTFEYPETGDEDWGSATTNWASAVTTGMLSKAGGAFTLTAEVDFGASYGVKALYFRAEGPGADSSAGGLRLSNAELVGWRNYADSGDLYIFCDTDDLPKFQVQGGSAQSLVLGPIVNASIDAAAAIAFSKMAALTASTAAVTNGSGVIISSATTATQVGYLSTTTSDVQTQLTARLQLAGGTMTGSLILNAIPTLSLEAATKSYVDSLAVGLNAKTAVSIATTANGTLASAFENGDTVDGVVLATSDRILIKNQSAPAENGIYTVNASGAPTRATDADTWAELVGAYVFVSAGTANTATSWVCNVAAGGTLNTTAVTFVQFSASQAYTASGTGITLTGSQFALQLDSTTLSQSGSGVKVNAIANAQIGAAAGIAVNKLAALTASRGVVSDGSGFLASATTTATEIGYVNGVTSAIQTQLDARIFASVMTTNNDMIYRAAGVPARLASGTTGYVLQSASGVPTWTDPKISTTYLTSDASSYTIQSTFTALTLVAVTASLGTPCTRSSDTINFAYTGQHEITIFLSVDASSNRTIMARLRNTTDSSTLDQSVAGQVSSSASFTSLLLRGNVTDIAKNYEIQLACSGGGTTTLAVATVNSVGSHLYQIKIDRPRQ